MENSPSSGLRRFETWWREDGLELRIARAYREPPPERPAGYDGLVLLGGGLMPTDDDKAPWLERERTLASAALDHGLPVLGVCLGGQLLAAVAGGVVQESYGRPEAGSTPLTLEPAAADDPLFRDLPVTINAIEHHKDAITSLPPDAVWLARSERCPYQAFRLGKCAWGLQFHPEVAAECVAAWDRQTLIDDGFDPDTLIRRAERDERTSAPVWRRFANHFAAVVGSCSVRSTRT